MKIISKVVLAIFLALCLLQGFSAGYRLQAKNDLRPNFVSDTMPNVIRIRLDDIGLCNLRNSQRGPSDQLVCNANDPQLDPSTYTMDEYVTGVLRGEVGPVADIAHWHIEALKAMAVKIRTFGWSQSLR